MIYFILRRLAWIVLTMFVVSLLTFILVFASGDPALMLTATKPGQPPDPVAIAQTRAKYGLDQPIAVQYLKYMGNLLRGDFGYSYYFRRPVLELMLEKFPNTALLASLILLSAVAFGVPLGALAAVKRDSIVDRAVLASATATIAVPTFFLALMLIYFVAFQWKLLPIGGHGSWYHLVMPTLSVALPSGMAYAIFLRTNMLNQVSADYARTARAKGLREGLVHFKHVLPNALIPVVTLASLDMAYLLTGIVLIETVFNYPGIGLQVLQAMGKKDIPVIMGSVFFGALLIGLGNLVADLLVARLDPRIRLGE